MKIYLATDNWARGCYHSRRWTKKGKNIMSEKKKTYRQLRDELDQILFWFDGEDLDVDEAIEKYDKAKALIVELESYLAASEQKITKVV
jgi:exodeoxyribonuclease VII small subunit